MNNKYYYLAGPMRGYIDYNKSGFEKAAEFLRGNGYNIVSPWEEDDRAGVFNHGPVSSESIDACMIADVALILSPHCLGLILMPNWRYSKGVLVEIAAAQFGGRQIRLLIENFQDKDYNHVSDPVDHQYLIEKWGQ